MRVESLEEYERLFNPLVAVRGESSPSYASHPLRKGAPDRIKALVPEAKFIYVVRDPIARTVSHHQHLVAAGAETRPIVEVLGDLSDPTRLAETCYSLYALQLEQYLERFPLERILVVDQSSFLADRVGTLSEIFTFLGVDADFASPEFDNELYKSSERRVYSRSYQRLVARGAGPVLELIPRDARRSIRKVVERAMFRPLEPVPLTEELRERLRDLYSSDVARLRQLTGKSFSTWSV
jgi:hypothetical protein